MACFRFARFVLLFAFVFDGASNHARASESLLEEIRRADADLFAAFNRCDSERMAQVFAADLEFYHDKSGLTDLAATMASTRANCERQLGLVRELVDESLEVHPIAEYGALQIGKHRFCHVENGQNDCGTFDFIHIWKRAADGWKLSRVISYDH